MDAATRFDTGTSEEELIKCLKSHFYILGIQDIEHQTDFLEFLPDEDAQVCAVFLNGHLNGHLATG